MSAEPNREPRRYWDAYQGDLLLGRVGADNSARAIAKAAKEYNVPANTVRVVSAASGKEPVPRAKGEALSTTEAAALASHEAVIERGLQTFVEVGTALFAIRDGLLYRDSHESFEAYCRERWGWSSRHVNQQIAAAQIASNVQAGGAPPITSIRQATPLTRLEPEQQQEVWQEAVTTAPNGQPSGEHVAATAERLHPRGQSRVNGELVDDPPDIARQRKAGKIPAASVPDITDPGDDATRTADTIEEHAERRAIQSSEQSDDEWLATLPIVAEGKLSASLMACFKRDALIFRALRDAVGDLRGAFGVAKRAVPKGSHLDGWYEVAVSIFLRRQHPRDWKVCPPTDKGGCNGNGSLLTGQCSTCKGRGYVGQ